jgi:Mn-containing catalase
LFHHIKELAYTVRVDKPNPVSARMLQQAIGGPEGEMRVMRTSPPRRSAERSRRACAR